MLFPRFLHRSNSGQTIIEVIIAAGIVALVLTAVVAAVTSSVKNTALAKSKTVAVKFSQEGVEFFRNQRAALGWEAFGKFFQDTGTTFCLASIPSTISQLTAGACTTHDYVDSKSTFQRSAVITLSTSGSTITNIKVVVTVTWVDGSVTKTSTITQNFQQWSLADAPTVKVLSGTNVALSKPATQNADYNSFTPASKAVDGNTSGVYVASAANPISLANTQANSWWQVDLGSVVYIGSVNIYGRTDGGLGSTQSNNFYLLVSQNTFSSTNLATTLAQQGVWNSYFPGTAGSPSSITVNQYGRYVRIQMNQTAYLSLGEVQVISGTPP
jgi:Tfp pilus assembly protein PilV